MGHVENSLNSAPHSSHVIPVTGWTLRNKCLDKFCLGVAWARLGLSMTVDRVLFKHSLDYMSVHPVLSHVTNSAWCPPLLHRIRSIIVKVHAHPLFVTNPNFKPMGLFEENRRHVKKLKLNPQVYILNINISTGISLTKFCCSLLLDPVIISYH